MQPARREDKQTHGSKVMKCMIQGIQATNQSRKIHNLRTANSKQEQRACCVVVVESLRAVPHNDDKLVLSHVRHSLGSMAFCQLGYEPWYFTIHLASKNEQRRSPRHLVKSATV